MNGHYTVLFTVDYDEGKFALGDLTEDGMAIDEFSLVYLDKHEKFKKPSVMHVVYVEEKDGNLSVMPIDTFEVMWKDSDIEGIALVKPELVESVLEMANVVLSSFNGITPN